jgi:hypothetical protein
MTSSWTVAHSVAEERRLVRLTGLPATAVTAGCISAVTSGQTWARLRTMRKLSSHEATPVPTAPGGQCAQLARQQQQQQQIQAQQLLQELEKGVHL